ncbi:hypothetical protein C6497_13035 [Candidatus Poribacteria bacterium]|nr:MAG: hypothetical protein C6497_13035 [Candidatus Poribacteria bacterium]
MQYKRILAFISFLFVSAFLVYFLIYLEDSERKKKAASIPIELPYTWLGNINKEKISEPSGVTYHPIRKTLFVVDDEGHIHEMRPDGSTIRRKYLQGRDLEGITINPKTGLLYVAVEDDEAILEVHPQTLTILREFTINRLFEGKTLLKKGGMGMEAIAFIPDTSHVEGGTFWIGNQSVSLKPNSELSVVCEVVIPIKSSDTSETEGTIIRYHEMDFIDISGLTYDSQADSLILISDTTNLLVELKRDGTPLHRYLLPGNDQEGVTLDGLGYMYIAQESGQIVKLADSRLR